MHSQGVAWAMIVACVAVPVGMLAWFKGKRWL
jgi:hypothetical protein